MLEFGDKVKLDEWKVQKDFELEVQISPTVLQPRYSLNLVGGLAWLDRNYC